MTLKYIWRSFSLSCHFRVHFSYPWHAFASHGLPATAELLVCYGACKNNCRYWRGRSTGDDSDSDDYADQHYTAHCWTGSNQRCVVITRAIWGTIATVWKKPQVFNSTQLNFIIKQARSPSKNKGKKHKNTTKHTHKYAIFVPYLRSRSP